MLSKIFKSYKTPAEKKENRKELLFGLISGILLGFSFPPIPLPYLLFVGLIPYLIVIEKRRSLAEINRFTYFTAFFFNIITLYWVGSWTPDADPFLMVAGTVLMFFNPIVFLIPSTLYYLARKYVNKNLALYLLPWFWLFYEYIYSITDFRFPWLSLSNGLPYFLSFIQIADIIGSYGITILIVYVNIFGYLTLAKINSKSRAKFLNPIILILLIIIPVIYGAYKLNTYDESDNKISIGLIQPNLNPNKKWEIGNLDVQIDLYQGLSEEAIREGAEIIIWPETALPVYLMSARYDKYSKRIQDFVDSMNVPIVTGMPHANFYPNIEDAPLDAKPLKNSDGAYTSFNSILYFAPQREVEQYGKIKLVPFGEKVPLVDIFPVLGKWIKWNVGISSWNTGMDTLVFNWNNDAGNSVNIGGVICIESIYPDFISSFVNKGADFIAVVTNDSWYGNSSGPYQHKEISVLRAIENRRTVVRAANGGISCIIDPLGRTIIEQPMFTKGIVVGEIELGHTKSIFTEYVLLFPIISILVVIFIILTFIVNKIRRFSSHD
jgi:apolipoprotein N-acyltransferase